MRRKVGTKSRVYAAETMTDFGPSLKALTGTAPVRAFFIAYEGFSQVNSNE